jgi:AcrR family transcriptional regulator
MRVRKNANLRKPEILKAFYDTIVDEGIEGASIGKIAKRMGIHPSLIMHYFSTKENMMREMVDHIIGEYSALLGNLRSGPGDPGARLLMLTDILWSDEWYGMTKIAADFAMASVSFRNPSINEKLRQLYAQFKKYMARELKGFMEAGVVRKQDPLTTAEVIITMLEGYRHFKHFYVDEGASESFREAMKEKVLLLLGYEGPRGKAARKRHGVKDTNDTEAA